MWKKVSKRARWVIFKNHSWAKLTKNRGRLNQIESKRIQNQSKTSWNWVKNSNLRKNQVKFLLGSIFIQKEKVIQQIRNSCFIFRHSDTKSALDIMNILTSDKRKRDKWIKNARPRLFWEFFSKLGPPLEYYHTIEMQMCNLLGSFCTLNLKRFFFLLAIGFRNNASFVAIEGQNWKSEKKSWLSWQNRQK